jgi:hypothetical protein
MGQSWQDCKTCANRGKTDRGLPCWWCSHENRYELDPKVEVQRLKRRLARRERRVEKLKEANRIARLDQSKTARHCAAQRHELKHMHQFMARIKPSTLRRVRKERGEAINERNRSRQALKQIAATAKTYNNMTDGGQTDDGRFTRAAWHDCVRIANRALAKRGPR